MQKFSCHNAVGARGPNFSADEKVCLLNIINKYKDIVENKKTDGVTWRDKDHIWKKITSEFNSSSPGLVVRSVQNLRTRFENQKKATRKTAAKERVNFTITGGGPSTAGNVVDDPIYNLTMQILNKKTVFGVGNTYDGDGTSASCSQQAASVQVVNEYEYQNDEDNIRDETVEEAITLEICDGSDATEENAETYNEEVMDWGNFKAPNLQIPVHPKLKAVPTPRSKPHSVPKKQSSNWSSRRRPALNASTSVARKYEDLAEIKIQIYREQFSKIQPDKLIEAEKLERERKEKDTVEKREEVLFQLRKEALQLDVNIKRAQLRQLESL